MNMLHIRIERLLFYLPRVLAVLYLCFLSLFAFDTPIFSIGFLIHLIPSFILLTAIIISWRSARTGAIIFLTLAGLALWFFHTYKELMQFLIIPFPLLVIGLLFCAEKYTMKGK